ncbi:MAG: hypothetical protein RR671_02855 [Raoultibacter sp.]
MVDKPASISANDFKSLKWDEITAGRSFSASDIPTLELLCQWHAIVARCMDDMDVGGDVMVAYENSMNDIKAVPQIGVLKQASAEIRAINKQLGINDEPIQAKETKGYVVESPGEVRPDGNDGMRPPSFFL